MNLSYAQLEQSLKTGFIDHKLPSDHSYLPHLLVNDKKESKKVLTTILQSLNKCEEFWFSVAFVTTNGVATLIETLINLELKGIKGKILVSQYLNFTQPVALKRLMQFKNIELKIAIDNAFHSKGYLFKNKNVYDLIIGSSNLTATALCTNIEWNLKISATPESYIIQNALKEFYSEFEKAVKVDKHFIENYEILYKKQVDYSNLVKKELVLSNQKDIVPNSMQVEALHNIEYLRSQEKNKALLISATGTGKTYLSAFDVKKFNPKKFLFVVHRLNIAKAAMKSYKSIFGDSVKMGIYSGTARDLEADFIFSTVQTISKEEHLKQFSETYFDYIVIDETHRAGAESYKKIIEYYKPKFLLGMTATPERTDGLDIFKLFDYNIAYEIRLHRALEEDILSPFHYYGVTDITVNGEILEDNSDFNLLTSDERIDRIIEKIQLYGCDNGIVKGLIFCSTVQECNSLSKGFNLRGLKTISLSGGNSEEERSAAIIQLESNQNELDYIFTVDIFNEGIDIPSVNQIIMLRPTQSAIIFVQQLGRGLRKLDNKEYLTVIDFIGNYKNNFLVPIALYGDTSYNKDTIRKLLSSGSSFIPGTSTINFDRIAREKIFEAIDAANMQMRRDLVNDYTLLKFKLGRSPMMVDFINHGSRDPYLYVNYSRSYYNFVKSIDTDLENTLSNNETLLLELFSIEINNSKRVEESILLKELIEKGEIELKQFKNLIQTEFGYKVSDETIASCINNLNFKFIKKEKQIVSQENVRLIIGEDLKSALRNETFQTYLIDSIDCSIIMFKQLYKKEKFIGGLIRYNKYSRKDVCRVLNWPQDISSTVYGYRTNNAITPCFVTYHKSDDITESTNYNDHFIDQNIFAWESRSNRKVSSPEIQNVIKSKRILLFIKKENGEGTDFYFMGDVEIIENSIEQSEMPDSKLPVVHFKFKLDHPVEDSIYEYLTSKTEDPKLLEVLKNEEKIEHFIPPFRILEQDEIKLYKNCIPIFDVKIAAGEFSDLQFSEQNDWIALNKPFNYSDDYFVCQVIGESMNKVIPNGSWCLFKKNPAGTRNGKIVLVHHGNIQEADFGKGLTIKRYESQKVVNEEGWLHNSIILKPESDNPKFENIILKDDELIDLKVVGEFIDLLK
jgi:superfamily II DNA or RNA helicase/HKD family nuclease/SOS-response transcriptional repressor LexA